MKFLLAITYLLVATVNAIPTTQETCEEAASNCSGWFNNGCNDQIWGEYANCVKPVCGGVNNVVEDAAHKRGC
jgi:hypothetical protein